MLVLTFCCVAAALLVSAATARGETVLRGTSDASVSHKGDKDAAAQIRFLTTKLGAKLLRFDVQWVELEPKRGTFDTVYLNELAQSIHGATSDGAQVIVTLFGTPAWASDRTLWRFAPNGYRRGVYHPFYPPAAGHLADFEAFASKLASTFAGDVLGYECRNEPNLWVSLYPQRTRSDAAFGARRYAAMLAAFSKGVRAGDPDALVIAGATAPAGRNDALSTSPQRFARQLKSIVPPAVFDAYSHHPYTVGGSRRISPEAIPRDPAHVVSLGNISSLLTIFPDKPFYLTEYGYYTQYCPIFGIYVSQITQASYVNRAYRYAARFPQIKALIWFPYQDWRHKPIGMYSGLVTAGGAYKRSWYAFAGGNELTLAASRLDGGSVRISGRLTSTALGGLRGKSLLVYKRTPGHAWHAVRNLTTGVNGAYRCTITQSGNVSFRTRWLGVVSSSPVLVTGS